MGYQMPDGRTIMRCPNCKEQFLYTKQDTWTIKCPLPDRLYYFTYVRCKNCDCAIEVLF